ncbi:hypothetical protein ACFLQ8_03555 [Candidatus Auribacterota bacterium]
MDWNVRQPGKVCLNCNTEFRNEDIYHSQLQFKDDELVRQDYCEVCFSGQNISTRESDRAYWKSRYKIIVAPPKEDPVKRDKVEHLLRSFLGEDKPQGNEKICYLLCVMLERKKILKPQSHVVDNDSGKKIIVYEHTKTGESFAFPDPSLSMDEIPQLQEKILELL